MPAAGKTQRRATRAVTEIEADIAEMEAEIADIDTAMTRSEIASDHLKLAPLVEARGHAAERLERYLAEWEAASAE